MKWQGSKGYPGFKGCAGGPRGPRGAQEVQGCRGGIKGVAQVQGKGPTLHSPPSRLGSISLTRRCTSASGGRGGSVQG